MTRILVIALLALGDPGRLTGGYLYHRRLAALAPRHNARIVFVSIPERPFPLAVLDAPTALGRARRLGAHVLVLDSIAAAFAAPFLARQAAKPPHSAPRSPALPLVGMLHQPPGGMDHAPLRTAIQARLDLMAYRRATLLLVASQSLLDELTAQGIPRSRIRVVPPGRDLAPSPPEPSTPPPDLRRGRRAALLCVGNWQERKGIHFLLEALSRLPPDAATLHLVGDD